LQKLKDQLEDACTELRGFTLGRKGFSEKDGQAGIKRVAALCDRLSKLADLSSSGPAAKTIVALGRGRIKAAEARLALLKKLSLS
jgi:hypothetical protein